MLAKIQVAQAEISASGPANLKGFLYYNDCFIIKFNIAFLLPATRGTFGGPYLFN